MEFNGYNRNDEAQACAEMLADSFHLSAEALLSEPCWLDVALVRWHSRNDRDDVESLHQINEIAILHGVSADGIAERAAHIFERDCLPLIDGFARELAPEPL